jgi:hypothetical protein
MPKLGSCLSANTSIAFGMTGRSRQSSPTRHGRAEKWRPTEALFERPIMRVCAS